MKSRQTYRCFLVVLLVVLAPLLLTRRPAVLAGESLPDSLVEVSRDIDLDGNVETLRFRFHRGRSNPQSRSYDRCEITVEEVVLTVSTPGSFPSRLGFVDIDSLDSTIEFYVTDNGPCGGYDARVFRFHNDETVDMGRVPLPITPDGAGRIATKCIGQKLSTWGYDCVYQVDESSQLVEVRQEFIDLDLAVTMKADLVVCANRKEKDIIGTIRAGELAVITKTDHIEWFFIESESGLSGWFRIEGWGEVNGAHPGETFDGLDWAG